jgi:hypothetical protein
MVELCDDVVSAATVIYSRMIFNVHRKNGAQSSCKLEGNCVISLEELEENFEPQTTLRLSSED